MQKNLTLAQLREAQRNSGVTPRRPDDDAPLPEALFKRVAVSTSSEPVGAEKGLLPTTEPYESGKDYRVGRGYTCIFPCEFENLGSLSADWIEVNWYRPSPWCRIEGLPEHPDFETNLQAFENN